MAIIHRSTVSGELSVFQFTYCCSLNRGPKVVCFAGCNLDKSFEGKQIGSSMAQQKLQPSRRPCFSWNGPGLHTSADIVQVRKKDLIWEQLRREAMEQSEAEPYLASFFYATVISHVSLERSLASHLANKLANMTLLSTQLFSLFAETFAADAFIQEAIREDIQAIRERDPACTSYVHGMLNYKGFLACQSYRISHRLWCQGRNGLALALQNRISEVFQVDIHPGARIGKGILFDHATGVVVGETAVIGDNVSLLHHVTLGGTGNSSGHRHPKVGNGVLIGAGATLLGPIQVGDGAKIGASSLVLMDIPPHTTAVGVPARIIGNNKGAPITHTPGDLPGRSMDHTTDIVDYVI